MADTPSGEPSQSAIDDRASFPPGSIDDRFAILESEHRETKRSLARLTEANKANTTYWMTFLLATLFLLVSVIQLGQLRSAIETREERERKVDAQAEAVTNARISRLEHELETLRSGLATPIKKSLTEMPAPQLKNRGASPQ